MSAAAEQRVILVIMDGWGLREPAADNAISLAETPCFDQLWETCPHTTIGASGKDVGLPEGQMGNSEVGHLNMGAGRRVLQELTRISEEIDSGEFYRNQTLLNAFNHAKKHKKTVHLVGLVSDGGVHSHIEHVLALLKLAKQQSFADVKIHAILDGRDTPPQSAEGYLTSLQNDIEALALPGSFATVSGRYYAMDRDSRWERIEKAYEAIVDANAPRFEDIFSALDQSYAQGETDEFVLPKVIDDYQGMEDKDAVIFFNFRPDRGRQLSRALIKPDFDQLPDQRKVKELHFVTFTHYADDIPAAVAFKPQELNAGLGEIIAQHDLTQLRLAETEKYAHVTFFFNGGRELVFPGEDRKLIPSPKVATYDLQPDMSADDVADFAAVAMKEEKYNLIVVNFANADMVGHSGVLAAAIQAVETVDSCLARLVVAAKENSYKMLITADHGNAEQMYDSSTGQPHSAHTCNPVPFILVNCSDCQLRNGGILADIAPTILQLLALEKPIAMTGHSLIKKK